MEREGEGETVALSATREDVVHQKKKVKAIKKKPQKKKGSTGTAKKTPKKAQGNKEPTIYEICFKEYKKDAKAFSKIRKLMDKMKE